MKLTKLDFYIIKRFLGAFLLALGLFTVIIIVFDLSEKIDDFIEKDAPLKGILFNYYRNWIPTLLNLFSPVFVFISVIFFTSKMAQKSEIVAILASGVSYLRLLLPYVITAVLLGAMSFVLNAWIIPMADKQRVEFENQYIRNRKTDYKRDLQRQIQPGIVMTLESYNYLDSFGYRLNMEHIVDSKVKSKLSAEKLRWNDETDSWMIENWWIRQFVGDEEVVSKGAKMDTMVPFNPDDFFRRNDDVQSMNLKELDREVELSAMRGDGLTSFYMTEKYRRFAAPFAIIILTIIGVCVSSRKSRGGVGLNLGIGLLISFAFLIFVQFFNAYGQSGSLTPLLAAFVPNILFTGIAYFLYRIAQK